VKVVSVRLVLGDLGHAERFPVARHALDLAEDRQVGIGGRTDSHEGKVASSVPSAKTPQRFARVCRRVVGTPDWSRMTT
jgi:hypothetical protein